MPRVYLIFRTQLFADAVRAVLGVHSEIELVGVTDRSSQVAHDVATLAPDVILLEETEDDRALGNVHAILASRAPCRLIMLRPDADGMHVWSQTWRHTVQARDLVDAIVSVGENSL